MSPPPHDSAGPVTFTVATNPAGPRTGTLEIAGQAVTVTQSGGAGTTPPPPTNLRIVH